LLLKAILQTVNRGLNEWKKTQHYDKLLRTIK